MKVKQWSICFFIAAVLCLNACTAEGIQAPLTVTPNRPSVPAQVSQRDNTPSHTPTSQPTETPLPTPSITPKPTGIFIYDDPIVFEQLPALAPLALNLDPTVGLVAYQQDKQQWLNKADLSGTPMKVTECGGSDESIFCLPQIHWSPDGTHFFYETAVNHQHQLIISDLQGQQQGFSISTTPYRDPVWSPDGRQIILFGGTNRPWDDHVNGDISANELGFIDEVWQLQMDSSGTWLPPQKLTELETPGIGCGGGGYSFSDYLYENQGGFTMGLQAAQKMFWARDDVIIYHLSCDYFLSQGYGRYDFQSNQPLAPYPGKLHGLTLDSPGRRWYAITGHNDENRPPNQLVTGTAADTDYELIETAVPIEMVFVGPHSGRLYYTARDQIDHKDLTDQVNFNFGQAYFNFYHTQLWTINPDGSDERLLWESDDHSYSRVTETSTGDILFVLIENDVDLYETLAGGAPEEEWHEHLPHTHVMRLSHGSLEPEIWLEDARDLTVWYPRE